MRIMRISHLMLVVGATVGAFSLSLAFGAFPQISAAAERAKAKYLAALEKAQQKYSDEAQQLFAEHLRDLEAVLETETKAGRLEVAVAVRDEIQRLRMEGPSVFAEAPPTSLRQAIARLTGTWQVVFPSGAIRVYVVDAKGNVSFPAEQRVAKLKGQPRELLVDFEDGKLERWTIADGRLFCEHWDPKTDFGKQSPALISVGAKVKP
jgi:hypothetical protein